MEDEHIALPAFVVNGPNGPSTASLFAVFDGHGGRQCAAYLHSRMSDTLRRWLGSTPNVETAFKLAFQELDEVYLSGGSCAEFPGMTGEQGSTAVVVLILDGVIYCANTGDSRALLCRKARALQLSNDHKPNHPEERLRIEFQGGFVSGNRVLGRLAVSRAFGDRELKAFVPSEPEVTATPLEEGDDFLVLGCDGLWDVVDNERVAQLTRTYVASKGLGIAARSLTTYAVVNGSGDNVTVLLVALRPGPSS